MLRRNGAVGGAAMALVAAIVLGTGGCRPAPTSDSAQTTAPNSVPAPSEIVEPTLVSGAVSVLRPGAPIMVGDDVTDDSRVCLAGFYIDSPGPDGNQLSGFITARQCARGDSHAPVFVTKTFTAEQTWEQTQVGAITYLAPGDDRPVVPDQPWTVAGSPLAVFGSGQQGWVLPVDVGVNGTSTTGEVVQTAAQAHRHQATWTNSFGRVVTGQVLDPAVTEELANLPAGVERVVIAADDPAEPIDRHAYGSPVTVDLDGVDANLGVVTGVDETRHWVVVDLIAPLLAGQGARLVTSAG